MRGEPVDRPRRREPNQFFLRLPNLRKDEPDPHSSRIHGTDIYFDLKGLASDPYLVRLVNPGEDFLTSTIYVQEGHLLAWGTPGNR